MNKSIKYAMNGALILGSLNIAIELVTKQRNNINSNSLLKAFKKGFFVGSIGGFIIGSLKDIEMTESLSKAGGSTGFIKKVLNKYSKDNNSRLLNKARDIQKIINDSYADKLLEYPSIKGSTIEGTSTHTSDIDIQVKFRKKAGRIRDLKYDLEKYLFEKYEDIELRKIRTQNYSTGIIYDLKESEGRIDVVAMRECQNEKGDLYIHSSKNDNIKKTNPQTSVLNINEKQKNIIKLLKGWKEDNKLNFPSILIKHIVYRAFFNKSIPNKIDKALFYVFNFITNNITRIKIIDPANSNNIISNTIDYNDKVYLRDFCRKILRDISYDERNIVDYFKL